jgi:hypothetical protein
VVKLRSGTSGASKEGERHKSFVNNHLCILLPYIGLSDGRLRVGLINFLMFGPKWMFFSLVFVLCLSSCGENNRDDGRLEIDRKYRASRMTSAIRDAEFVEVMTRERATEKLESGLYKLVIPLSPSLAASLGEYFSGGQKGAGVDPFADPDPPANSERQPRRSLQQALEEAGVKFAEGTSAKYSSVDWTLTVVNSEEQIELVEAYFDSLVIDYETTIYIRAEIYELAAEQVLQLIESAAHEPDHTPERNAAKRAVQQGEGRLVAMPSVIGRSGQKSTVEDLTEMFPSDRADERDREVEEKESKRRVSFGTILEVDPVLGANEYTIDLMLSLKHDLVSGSNWPSAGKAPTPGIVTHPKSISTQITLIDGSYRLVGSWTSGEGTMQVVFLTAAVQYLSDMRPVVKIDSPPEREKGEN